MKKHKDGETSVKPRRTKSQEVSSRFLSSPGSTPPHDGGMPSPRQASSSPVRKKPIAQSLDSRRSLQGSEDPGPPREVWPSATTISVSSKPDNKRLDTLADCLGSDRLKDILERKNSKRDVSSSSAVWLNRQRSCTEISRFESDSHQGISGSSSSSLKENHRPILGGSMRYTGKFFPGRKSSTSSSAASSALAFESPKALLSGRLSIDENALYKSSSCRISTTDPFLELLDSGSESSDLSSSCGSNLSSASRKSRREVSSRYMNNLTRHKRGNLEVNVLKSELLGHDSEKLKKLTIKGAIKRAGSLTGYGSSMSQWALSPGRTGPPPILVENKSRPLSFSNLKPPSSPSRSKGVEKLLNMGLDLFKSKKSSPSNMSPSGSSNGGENFHQLRLLHNRLMQWRFTNAKSDLASQNFIDQAERSLLLAWESTRKLRNSVVQKKLQFKKERLEMKLNRILCSQMKPLELWEAMERKHSSAISNTVESLHSVVCRVQLQEGAQADPITTCYALRHASDLTSSIKSFLNGFTCAAESAVPLLSELAEVVAQEKLLLEECLEHLRIISLLEIEERNLTCTVLQLGYVPAIA